MSAPTKPTALTCAPIALTAAFGLLFSTPASAQANLVTNPGFETGDLTGYTLSGNSAHYVSVGTGIGHSGIYALDFGNNPPDATLTQDIPTVAGDSYTISYYLLSPDVSGFPAGTIADHFSSSFGGTALFDQNNLPAVTLPAGTAYSYPATFQFYSFTATAQVSSTPIQFDAFNEPSFFLLDDISVTHAAPAVPEPPPLALLGMGGLGLALAIRKRRRA